jgi:radical SAM superfamily enzyme YgiQ (UPF0313 family)
VDFAIDQQIDTVQFMILTPFPGTQLYDDLVAEDRLIHRRWDFYDAMFAVFWPRNLSPTRLQRETIEAYKRFYSLPRFAADAVRFAAGVTVDALTWDFRRALQYNFETILLRGGARFIVGRYAKLFDPYVEYLQRLEQENIEKAHREPA